MTDIRKGRFSSQGHGRISGALNDFYSLADGKGNEHMLVRILYSMRSVILVISFQSAIIAGLLSLLYGMFRLLPFLLVLLAFVMLHAESNLLNDYFGFRRGHDTPDSPRRRYTLHPLADNILSNGQMLILIAGLGAVLLAIASYFILLLGAGAFLLVTFGSVALLSYDAFPVTLKSIGLGELASFVVWGPLMIGGGFYVITGTETYGALLASIPYGLGVMSILVGKHLDQEAFDRNIGQRTLPVLIGSSVTRYLLIAILVLMYAIPVFSVFIGLLPLASLVILLNWGRLSGAVRRIRKERPDTPPDGYIGWPLWYHRACLRHEKYFGWLFISGLLLALLMTAVHIPSFIH
ncbi:MAG: prenyltransferase [Thermoplasmata archaeon]|uniref:Prenyltransferase n=1 Tax=Candidatus Sysuiplasma superficiale TaxID=2823368 RepID=A0A8J7YTD6_9ARCH|nr:prenyltransferase [Candidatus Sysuiplasma superficiale]